MRTRLIVVVIAALVCASRGFAQTATSSDAFAATTVPAAPPAAVEAPPPGLDWMPTTGNRIWFQADYNLSWIDAMSLPPLVTTSAAGTARAKAGVLGQSTTTTLFGGSEADNGVRSGLHLEMGGWLDEHRTLGIVAGGTITESQAELFSVNSADLPSGILARPFFNVTTGKQDAVVVAFPGSSTGSVDVRAASGNFYEGHIDLTEKFADADWAKLFSILGYRFYRYDEGLHIRQTLSPTSPTTIPGTQVVTDDDFSTHNEFHGVDIGLRGEFTWQNWSLDLLGKVAVGGVNRRINIQGQQTVNVPGVAPVIQPGGVLALTSNSGVYQPGDWTVMPEVGLNLCWHIRPNVCLRAGYSVLWLDRIARAGDQVNLNINPALFPPPAAGATPRDPSFTLIRSNAWMQSIHLGLEFSF